MSDTQDELQQAAQALDAPPPPGARLLLRVVYTMGIVLVLLFLLLIVGIVWKAATRGEAPPPEARHLDLALPAGTSVRAMELDGDRLAVDTGSEILVIDLRKNAVISRIGVAPR